MILNALSKIGHGALILCSIAGKKTSFTIKSLRYLLTPPFYVKELWFAIINIGFYSIPVIGMTAIFTGAVLALQTYSGFARFHAESSIAAVVTISITRELGPVIGGLMVAGRVSSAIAAEVGTMKVTEQLDALRTLSTSPYRYLYAPRIAAGIISLPILVLITNIIGIYGGYLVATHKLGFNASLYIQNSFKFLEIRDVLLGMVKAVIFGFIITTIGCYCGNECTKGAKGVGNATTNSLVYSSTLILISNYITTSIFFL
ncbi:putative ABC transporter permease protein RBE_1340 [Candidatus Xenohaliotis californiensis]|uniref:ABC transporter permease protein RBE_1340 n=1 Tax=Candidatus Xenohaliotis californiensis TaxID=84677 RepID=A0ABP0EUF7_9RICK|nr:putative ABC transporter permease protein RBE_1340 [Candidatus Xenohaliotis californiensis]